MKLFSIILLVASRRISQMSRARNGKVRMESANLRSAYPPLLSAAFNRASSAPQPTQRSQQSGAVVVVVPSAGRVCLFSLLGSQWENWPTQSAGFWLACLDGNQ